MIKHNFSRRQFGAIAGAGLAGVLRAAGRKIPIGVQLYSVRQLCAKDFPGTLAGVAKLGYEGVEFAGYYDRTAAEVKKMLDDNGLKCCGTHIGVDTLLGDNFARTVEFNQTIGNRYLICPGLPEKYRASREAWRETAKLFTEISQKLKPHKMLVGYHNHAIEFKPLDGENPWDTFFGNAGKDVVMQLDIGHAVHAGADPAAVLKRYPGQAKTVHVKDYSPTKRDALIGDGEVKWKDVLAACRGVASTEWYIIEEESNAYPGLDGIAQSLKKLKALAD
jgi:sugar phosphate isomerase/epimerase